MYRFAAAFIGMSMLAVSALADTPNGDTLKTLDQFMIARSVAAKCAPADDVTAAAFEHSYQMVAERAQLALKALASDLSQAHIEKIMSDHYGEIDRQVSAIVTQESCDGEHAKEALQKYDAAARMESTRLLADKSN